MSRLGLNTPTVVALALTIAAISHKEKGSAVAYAPLLPSYEQESVSITRAVHRQLEGESIVSLREVLSLGSGYNGQGIKSVKLKARTHLGFGKIELLLNGTVSGRAKLVGTRSNEQVFVLYPGESVLGAEIQSVELRFSGNFILDDLSVELVDYTSPTLTRKDRLTVNGAPLAALD